MKFVIYTWNWTMLGTSDRYFPSFESSLLKSLTLLATNYFKDITRSRQPPVSPTVPFSLTLRKALLWVVKIAPLWCEISRVPTIYQQKKLPPKSSIPGRKDWFNPGIQSTKMCSTSKIIYDRQTLSYVKKCSIVAIDCGIDRPDSEDGEGVEWKYRWRLEGQCIRSVLLNHCCSKSATWGQDVIVLKRARHWTLCFSFTALHIVSFVDCM